MGGSIRVVTKIDGVISKQTRWTNSLPQFVKNESFLNCDREYVQEYNNRESKYRESNETFSPNSYGLDFYDFDSKKIYTNQGYCGYSDIDMTEIFIYLHGRVANVSTKNNGSLIIDPILDDSKFFFPTEVKKMWESNMLSCNVFTGSKKDPLYDPMYNKSISKEDMGNISFETCLALMEKFGSSQRVPFGLNQKSRIGLFSMFLDKTIKHKIKGFNINWKEHGWELKEYDESELGFKLMLSDLQKDYVLSDTDIKEWDQFINDRYKEE